VKKLFRLFVKLDKEIQHRSADNEQMLKPLHQCFKQTLDEVSHKNKSPISYNSSTVSNRFTQ